MCCIVNQIDSYHRVLISWVTQSIRKTVLTVASGPWDTEWTVEEKLEVSGQQWQKSLCLELPSLVYPSSSLPEAGLEEQGLY